MPNKQNILIKCNKCGHLIQDVWIVKQRTLIIEAHECPECNSYNNHIEVIG